MYFAPFDVRLPDFQDDTDELTYTVVQPDISVICDLKKPDEKGCVGAPDLIIEILSPSTVGKDVKIKLSLYENKVFTET
jgi:Uma2 family endonuclease